MKRTLGKGGGVFSFLAVWRFFVAKAAASHTMGVVERTALGFSLLGMDGVRNGVHGPTLALPSAATTGLDVFVYFTGIYILINTDFFSIFSEFCVRSTDACIFFFACQIIKPLCSCAFKVS